ncbi:MAG: hypothetical protein V4592_19400 [Bacteroidota bacterium]
MKKRVFAAIALGTILLSSFTKQPVQSQNKMAAAIDKAALTSSNLKTDATAPTFSNRSKANLSQADGGE